MKARELKDLRANNPQDLVAKLGELKAELFNLRFQLATGQLENTARIRQVRKTIARIKTVIRERELNQ
mgnify:CR=1 FL=1